MADERNDHDAQLDRITQMARKQTTELVNAGFDVFDSAVSIGMACGFIQVWGQTCFNDERVLRNVEKGFEFGLNTGRALALEAAGMMGQDKK